MAPRRRSCRYQHIPLRATPKFLPTTLVLLISLAISWLPIQCLEDLALDVETSEVEEMLVRGLGVVDEPYMLHRITKYCYGVVVVDGGTGGPQCKGTLFPIMRIPNSTDVRELKGW